MTLDYLEERVSTLESIVYHPISKGRIDGLLEELEFLHREISALYNSVSNLLQQVQDQGVSAIEVEEYLSILGREVRRHAENSYLV